MEVPEMLRDGLIAAGVEADRITLVASEAEAVDMALNTAQPDDLLIIFADELARSWKQIIYFKKAEREAIITAKPPRVERPAAEFEELVSATDLLIRDERGVRLARAEPEGAD